MKTIDGRLGEGGGQILRTTLSLAMCLGFDVRIDNIRAGRRKPGLLRQHLACVRSAAQVCNARVTGDEMGSNTVTFAPGQASAGNYRVAIGSAGSTTLVLQTLLPALLLADAPSSVTLEGGTHNGMAPSADFLELAFAPLLARMGYEISLNTQRHGFYPNGGGLAVARVTPADGVRALELTQAPENAEVQGVITYANLPRNIAQREHDYLKRRARLRETQLRIAQVDSPGPGNVVSLRASNDGFTNMFDAYAARGVKAERVAGRALRALNTFTASAVPVDEHLADQILLPMVLGAGGSFLTGELSLHTTTNIEVMRTLAGADIRIEQAGDQRHVIHVTGLRVVA